MWLATSISLLAAVASGQVNSNDYPIDMPYTKPAKPNGLATEHPNMILFMPDQLRFDAVGTLSEYGAKTPNIDAFAREGIKFENCFAQASTCSQSRNSMFGHRSLENLLKPWEPNVFRTLRDQGYHVAYLSPRGDFYAQNATESSVNEYGFLTDQTLPDFVKDDFPEPKDYLWNRLFYRGVRNETAAFDYDAAMIRGALQWLERPPQDKPWVLFLPLIFPHPPFSVEEPWFSLHNRSEMRVPPPLEDRTGHVPSFIPVNHEAYGLSRANDSVWQEVTATYYGMISRVDHQFGQIVNQTKALGLWDSTITFFFTDHGEFLGDWGLVEKWPSGVSDNLVHDPLIIGGAGLPTNVTFEPMVEMIDLVPTFMQFGQVNETYDQYGRSFVDAIHALGRGDDVVHREYAYTEGGFLLTDEPLLEQGPFPYDIKVALQHNDTKLVGKGLAVRDLDWTYIYRLYEADELYSRRNDADEMHNLASLPEFAPVRAKMREVALHWMISTPSPLPWYKDDRRPAVPLDSPYEQFLARGGEWDDSESAYRRFVS